MAAVQWGINPDGSVYNASAYQPSYEMINNRLVNDTTTISFNETIQSPKAEYFNTNDSLDYVIWYEDSRSVESKIKLAKMFDIEQISVWRLGNIPDYIDDKDKPVYMDVLETIIE
jgi:spore germination protein YaaH